jgi:hypothetical protein
MSSLYSSVGIRFQQILIDLHTKEVTTHFKSNSLLEKKENPICNHTFRRYKKINDYKDSFDA